MPESPDPCDDYACERPLEGHSHVGVQPHLRLVMNHGLLIDGKTMAGVQRVQPTDMESFLFERNLLPVAKPVPGRKKPSRPARQVTVATTTSSPPKPKAPQRHDFLPADAVDRHQALLAQDQTVCQLCGHRYVSHALGGGRCYMTPCPCQQFWAEIPIVGPGL